jgi:hypothetical protein
MNERCWAWRFGGGSSDRAETGDAGLGHGSGVRTGAVLVGLAAVMIFAGPASAQDKPRLNVKWGPDYRTLACELLGKKVEFPEAVVKGEFPAPGSPPRFETSQDWPRVAVRAKWSAPTDGWPETYRPHALDLILMHACDAQLYENIYPDFIRSAKFKSPPQYLKEAQAPEEYRLAESMHGQLVQYEAVGKAGFGAKDYQVKTKIRIGLSEDGKSVFYHDRPYYVSDHYRSRDFVFAAHDAGDRIHVEVMLVCIFKPRSLFKDEAMKRVEKTARYMVQRLYEDFDDAPKAEEIEAYFEQIKKGERPGTALLTKP